MAAPAQAVERDDRNAFNRMREPTAHERDDFRDLAATTPAVVVFLTGIGTCGRDPNRDPDAFPSLARAIEARWGGGASARVYAYCDSGWLTEEIALASATHAGAVRFVLVGHSGGASRAFDMASDLAAAPGRPLALVIGIELQTQKSAPAGVEWFNYQLPLNLAGEPPNRVQGPGTAARNVTLAPIEGLGRTAQHNAVLSETALQNEILARIAVALRL